MIIIISGPSTIGKDSVWVKAAQQLGFIKYVPYTTRKIRDNEIDSLDYKFLDVTEFQSCIRDDQFIEWDYFCNNYYGTKYDIYDLINHKQNIVFHALFRLGYRLSKKLPCCYTISLTSSRVDILSKRLINRGYEGEEHYIRSNHIQEENQHSSLADYRISEAESCTQKFAVNKLKKIIDLIQS